jgi:NHLM bacteriocin system ABC transporter peptidase/ATP-binding protein/NHLM bacteriocin system ABC transporter ATP-binding protein
MASSDLRRSRPVKTPTVLQMEAAECGAAALGIILEYHGRYVPLDVLREECGVSRDGSNALYIKEAAKRHGLEVKAFRKPAEGLTTRRTPFLVFWESNHFLVVEGFGRRKVYLNDPAVGRRTVSLDEFRRSYSGIAFTFETGPQFVKQGGKPSALIGLVRRLSRYRAAMAFVILAGLALVIPNLTAAAFQRVFFDSILVEGHREWLRPLLLAIGAMAVMRLAAAGLQQVYLTRLEVRLMLTESLGFMRHALRLPVAFFQRRFTGDIVTRAHQSARVAELISGDLATTAVSLLTLVVYVAVMLPFDPILTAVGVAIGGLNLLALRLLGRWRVDRSRTIEQLRGRLMAGVMWAIQIIESIKATGSESDLLVRWTGDQARMINAEQELGACDALLVALPPLLAGLTSLLVLGFGGYQVMVGTLTIGSMVAFQSLLAGFNQPFGDLARLGTDVQELRADLDRIDDVRNRPLDPVFARSRIEPTAAAACVGGREELRRLTGHVEFRQVSFGYNRTVEEPLIKGFSFVARPGQRIALVGSSGSGKSTIGRLLAGLYQPWSGEILFDGRPMAEIPREVFVSSIALVDAEISLFEGTVRDNLSLWDELIPMERLVEGAVDAAIHRDLLSRRGGYGAAVAEQGRNFSGGQRQRLQIARALSRDPCLVILDEASSALDPKTEQIVDDNLRRRGCTCLIIAHRLTTIRDCDEIIVLSGGHVVQRGTHDELIADPQGEYARLVSHQALPGRRLAGRPIPRNRSRSPAQALASPRGEPGGFGSNESEAAPPPVFFPLDTESDSPRFIVEELMPYSRPERTAANLPLALDDAEAVWLVTSGGVDVFFTKLEPGAAEGRRRHLCRVEEGGSIFAINAVRGCSGGGLLAVGAGAAEMLKFSRGDLIRLSFEEGLSDQVAVLIDDWLLRVGLALYRAAVPRPSQELARDTDATFAAGSRYRVRSGVAWVRHHCGTSSLLDQVPLPVTELQARFPVTEHLWLTADTACRVTACGTTAMIRSGDPWAGLDDFHRTALDFIAGIDEQEAIVRWMEVRRSLAHEAALIESVSAQLAAAAAGAPPVATVDAEGGGPLASACRAVCDVLGIEVRAPRAAGDQDREVPYDHLGELARFSGFHVRPVALREGWWRRRGEPLLGQLVDDGGPPVALLPVSRSLSLGGPAYELRDPDGRRHAVDHRLAGRVATTGWAFYRPLPDDALGFADLLHFCRGLRGLGRELVTILIVAFFGALLGLSIPIASGILVDQVLPEADLPRLAVTCGFLGILTISAAVFHAIQGLLVIRIEGRVSATLIPAIWERLLRLPSRFYAGYSSGDLALRAMGLSEVFQRASGAVVTSIVTGLFSLFNLGLLYCYSWKLALCTNLLVAVLLLVTALLLAGRLRHEVAIRRIDGILSGLLLEFFGGIITLRSAGAEGRALARWARRYGERLAQVIHSRRFSNAIRQWLAVYPILTSLVVYSGAVHLDPDLMKAGSFLAFNIAFANLVATVLAGCSTAIGLLDLLPMCTRIKPILEESPEFPAALIEPVRLAGALALNRVSFRYPGQDRGTKVIDEVSLQVRSGEFVAIVGPSGSGKSTLMRLLLGFETPDSGTVTFDGRELATLDRREVRRQIGVVLQHAQLMPSDIYSNIVGFAPALGLDDAWRAARLAGLEEDIRAMPMGMHTLVGEGGGNLSSGQRQRLLIARAIVHRPKILLLDEATSALDNVTQNIVSDSLTNQLRGVSRVVIAHRLDGIVKADRIYVLKDGRIVQSGRFDQLLAEPGPFRDLARRQML